MPFRNRSDAGSRLAQRLVHLRGEDVVVLGLPRGGVPVAYEVARALCAPLDVTLVRKLGLPHQPELAMGAIGEAGVRVLNPDVMRTARLAEADVAAVESAERHELERRVRAYRRGREPARVRGRTAVVVDDGIATGASARAACEIVRSMGAKRVIMAVPVAPASAVAALQDAADEVVCVESPRVFYAIGQWYDDFTQTTDDEVTELLDAASILRQEVVVPAGDAQLPGYLTVPSPSSGFVIFVHGSDSGRDSPRNRYVADVLASAGLGTLLFDLLTPVEAGDRGNVFDVGLLASRVTAAIEWLGERRATFFPGRAAAPVLGLFGASTGAAAALSVAADFRQHVGAVVSRGGRPDLAGDRLPDVTAPTLLIVGSLDETVVELNREASKRLANAELSVIPGASHLFEEPGALETAAAQARDWFRARLG